MRLKISQIILLLCFLNSIMGLAIYPGGCYECEEEVWEEVPCDEIPTNSTTISPPLPCFYTTTSSVKPSPTTTPQPVTTTTILFPTTAPETTTLTPTTIITNTPTITTTATPTTTATITTTVTPTTILTTTPPTTMTTTTTTTSTPIETTKPRYDSFKKCYCECKVGCKEFCRKVVVNPEPKKQIVQFSKITEPVAQGKIQLTHYHQRELIANPVYNNNYGTYGDDSSSQPPIIDNNIYSSTESNIYQSTTPTPPSTSNDENQVIINNENLILPVAYHDKHDLNLVQALAYAHADAGFKNIYSDSLPQISQAPHPPPPTLHNYEPQHNIVNNENSILPVSYPEEPVLNPVQPIPYTHAEATLGNFNSYTSSQIASPPQPQIEYFTAPHSGLYDFPVPFDNIYSKFSKTILAPTDSAQISIAPSIPNSQPPYSSRPCNSPSPTYISPTPVKSSQLETQVSLGNSLNYDDSFDDLIKEFMSQHPSNDASYETHSDPFYSMPYSS